MELLPTTKRILTWLCIYRASEFTQKWEKIAHIVFSMMVVIGIVYGAAASFAYFLLFMSTDLVSALYAFMTFIALYSQMYVMISIMMCRNKVCDIFEQLSTIYSASKCSLYSI